MVKVIGSIDYDLIKTFLSNLDALDVKLSTLQRTRVYEQSFEDGTSDLTAYNCTQEVQTSEVFAGHYALKVTVSSGQSGYVETPRVDISPYQTINFSLVHKENEYVQNIKLVVIWRRSAGGEIERYEVTLTPSSEWKPEDVTLMSPKNTATMTIRFEITAKTDGNAIVYLDDIFMDRIGILMRQDSEGNVLVKDEGVLSRLDIELSTRASESTLSAIRAQTDKLVFDVNNRLAIQNPPNLDVLLSTRASESTLSSIYNRLDVALGTRASESTLSELLNSIRPSLKGSLFNQPVTANTNIFASYLTPASPPCTFRIFACFNISGVLSVVKRVGATEIVMQLNGGNTLSANCLYAFDIAVAEGEEINFRYSADATALDVKVLEIPASIS